MQPPSSAHCRLIVPLLRSRDGQKTYVHLSGERILEVFNIAWGDDIGDDYEHLTSNISPGVPGAIVDLFFTDEVASVTDGEGSVLWQSDGVPRVR
jgi:hypothetical protein